MFDDAGPYRLQAADVHRWFEDVCQACPDVVLLDLTLEGSDVVPWIPKVVARCPDTMVAALTARPAEEQRPVLDAGAFVFYEKAGLQQLPDRLEHDLALFRRALAGHQVLAPAALRPRTADTQPQQAEA